MLLKKYTKTDKCRVTFKYPNHEQADSAAVTGEFNNWSAEEHPMKKLKNGSFSATLFLHAGKEYHFRYVLDNRTWTNDPAADKYVSNGYGEENSVVIL